MLNNLGPHGLPLIGRADWNDCLNLNCFSETPDESFQTTGNRTGRTAESVFIAGMFVGVAPDYAYLAEKLGFADEAKKARGRGGEDDRRRARSTAGTASGSCAPTTSSATRSAARRTRRGRS